APRLSPSPYTTLFRSQIVGPVSVAIDTKHDEMWVANYGDHTAVVFPRTASGNVRPKRTIRNAPKDTPTCGFTNASAAAYDSKRRSEEHTSELQSRVDL